MPQLFNIIYDLHTKTAHPKMKQFLDHHMFSQDEMNSYINPVIQSELAKAQKQKMKNPSIVIDTSLEKYIAPQDKSVEDIRKNIKRCVHVMPDEAAQKIFADPIDFLIKVNRHRPL